MWHTKVFWKKSLIIQTDETSVFINPYFDHLGTKKYIKDEKNNCQDLVLFNIDEDEQTKRKNWSVEYGKNCHFLLEDAVLTTLSSFSFIPHNSNHNLFLEISYAGQFVLFDLGVSAIEFLDKKKYDLIIFASGNSDLSLALAEHLRPRVGIPLGLSDEQSIEFCRQLMLRHFCVPKFLKNGQYVVHDENH